MNAQNKHSKKEEIVSKLMLRQSEQLKATTYNDENEPNRSKYGQTEKKKMKNCIFETTQPKERKTKICLIFLKRHKWNNVHLNASITPLSVDRVKDQVKEVCRRDDIQTKKEEMWSNKYSLCTT